MGRVGVDTIKREDTPGPTGMRPKEMNAMNAIQFETVIVGNTIRIPEQYAREVPPAVKVTLVPATEPKIRYGLKAKAGALPTGYFSAARIDTRGFKFDREEANER
jgi:hypothetical protein